MDFLKRYILDIQRRLPKVLTRDWLINELKTNNLFFIWGFTGCDLTNIAFDPELYNDKDIRLIAISTTTKLPDNHPFKYINEESIYHVDKDIQKLHKQGIDGTNINIAIIDNCFKAVPKEIKNSLYSYKKMFDAKESSFHGSVVSCQLGGENLGIAPKSKLYFYATPEKNQRDFNIAALKDIINLNEQGADIRIVSISAAAQTHSPEYPKLKEKLAAQGCYIIDSVVFANSNFTSINKDPISNEYYFSPWQDGDTHSKRMGVLAGGKMLPLIETENEYLYCGWAAFSWAIPCLAGIFALALQVNPNLTYDEFVTLAWETKIVNEQGLSLINPLGIIEKLEYVPSNHY